MTKMIFKGSTLLGGVVALGIVGFSGSVFAQATSTVNNPVPGSTASVDITLTGTVVTALTISVDSTATMTTAGAAGTINFGANINSSDDLSPTNADISIRDVANSGLFVGAELDAVVSFSGLPGADVTMERLANAGAAPDVAAGRLRYQAGTGNAWTNSGTSGTSVPDPATTPIVICGDGALGGASCANNGANPHEVTVFIPDTQGAGVFTTVVRYTATGG